MDRETLQKGLQLVRRPLNGGARNTQWLRVALRARVTSLFVTIVDSTSESKWSGVKMTLEH